MARFDKNGQVPVLYLVACAAPPASSLPEGVEMLRAAGWDVWVSATPAAAETGFLDRASVAAASGHPVRVEARSAGDLKVPVPTPDAVAVVPLTVNSLAKWATLINDNAAVGTLNELTAAGVPVVAQTWAKQALRDHPAFAEHVSRLVDAGVRFLPHGAGYDRYSWEKLAEVLAEYLP
jgi:phosphopantothenoylcysteine decarboxylase